MNEPNFRQIFFLTAFRHCLLQKLDRSIEITSMDFRYVKVYFPSGHSKSNSLKRTYVDGGLVESLNVFAFKELEFKEYNRKLFPDELTIAVGSSHFGRCHFKAANPKF